jgi:hypothetical protein
VWIEIWESARRCTCVTPPPVKSVLRRLQHLYANFGKDLRNTRFEGWLVPPEFHSLGPQGTHHVNSAPPRTVLLHHSSTIHSQSGLIPQDAVFHEYHQERSSGRSCRTPVDDHYEFAGHYQRPAPDPGVDASLQAHSHRLMRDAFGCPWFR